MKDNLLNKIYNEDFILFSLNNIPSESIDLIVTDPPYLINYKEWDNKEFEWHNEWLKECYRILKPGGTIWSFMAFTDKSGKENISAKFIELLNKYFIVDLRNTVVWARQKGRGSSKHLKSQREDIYYAYKDGAKPTWNNLKMLREVICPYVKDGKPRGWFLDENGKRVRWTGLGNVWTYNAPQWNSKTEKQLHPAQKPILLIERLIRLSSNEENIVLDPFIGSGTTALAAILANRKFIGTELNKEYYDIANKRISEFNPNLLK